MLKLTIGGAKLEFLEEVGGFLTCFFGVVDRDLGGLLGSLCYVLARMGRSVTGQLKC